MVTHGARFPLPAGARVLRACIGVDPGVQTGLALVALVRLADGSQVIRPLEVAIIGQRAVRSPKSAARPARAPTAPEVRAEVARLVRALADRSDDLEPLLTDPALVCEDWFIGPNGQTVRDTARGFYQAEAAAEQLGLRFRAVPHGTWKAHALGTARPPGDVATAYGARALEFVGAAAADAALTERWAPASGKPPAQADDAAALCIAHWYLSTEALA